MQHIDRRMASAEERYQERCRQHNETLNRLADALAVRDALEARNA